MQANLHRRFTPTLVGNVHFRQSMCHRGEGILLFTPWRGGSFATQARTHVKTATITNIRRMLYRCQRQCGSEFIHVTPFAPFCLAKRGADPAERAPRNGWFNGTARPFSRSVSFCEGVYPSRNVHVQQIVAVQPAHLANLSALNSSTRHTDLPFSSCREAPAVSCVSQYLIVPVPAQINFIVVDPVMGSKMGSPSISSAKLNSPATPSKRPVPPVIVTTPDGVSSK